jgi:hypothetical protein
MSIFATNNASQISKLIWKAQDVMVARLMDWNCNIFCLVIGLSRNPMLKLGGVLGLRVGLGQSASMELGELGKLRELRPIIAIPNLPSIKSYHHLSTFLMA